MSLINRVALCNFSNALGEDADRWSPRFRYEILDFHGQSTVINLINGGGKTTMANAIVGLLSRHPTLLSKSKEHAAPRKVAHWSHIQVELIEPLGSGLQQDMVASAGGPVAGETWVFGMALHADGAQNEYYYYPGALEDLAPGIREGGKLRLKPNETFKAEGKQLKGMEWGPTQEAWHAKLDQHIPSEVLHGQAQFQLKGGADKDAPIFKLAEAKRLRDSLDVEFFYEVLAPELLSDILEADGDESGAIDEQLYRIIRDVVNTRYRLAVHRTKVEQMSEAMEHLTAAAEKGQEAKAASEAYAKAREAHALDMAVFSDLVEKRPVPGVPRAKLPEGKRGEVAAHLVVVPGESEPRITDRGLAVILGMQPKVLNQTLLRAGEEGRKVRQVVEIPCDLLISTVGEKGQKSSTYTIKQATAFLEKQGGEDARVLFEDAVSWFERDSDTNPFRANLLDAEVDQRQAHQDQKEASDLIERLQAESIKLREAQEQVQVDEAAFGDLKASGLFTTEELEVPAATGEAVAREHADAQRDIGEFERQQARLSDYMDEWKAYSEAFGEETPESVAERLQAEKKAADEALAKNRAQVTESELAAKESDRQVTARTRQIARDEQALERLQGLKRVGAPVLEALSEGDSPVGLEKQRREALSAAEKAHAACDTALTEAHAGVEAIEVFKRSGVGEDPAAWLDAATKERSDLTVKQSQKGVRLTDLQRQRGALDVDPVAAGQVAQQALDLLAEKGLPHQELHGFLMAFGLPEDRQKDLLGMFSGLLFAPVVADPARAVEAADALFEAELPVPVFMGDALGEFLRDGDVAGVDATGRAGLFAGRVTRQVECLLDPDLVDREKLELDARIEEMQSELQAIANRLEEIAPEGELVRQARAAAAALEAGAPAAVESLAEEFERREAELKRCQDLLTEDMQTALRAAEDFAQAGGSEQLDALSQRVEEAREVIEELRRQASEHETRASELREARQGLEKAAQQAYPTEMQMLVNRAGKFVSLGGPQFLATEDSEKERLTDTLKTASDRAAHGVLFNRAQRWLDYQQDLASGEGIDDRIRKNAQAVDEAAERRRHAKERIDEAKKRLPRLRDQVTAVDEAAIALIGKYTRAMAVDGKDSQPVVSEVAMDGHPLGKAGWALRDAVEDGAAATAAAEALSAALSDYDIDAELTVLRSLSRQRDKAVEDFVDKAKAASKVEKGLAEVERLRLAEVSGVDAVDWIASFSNEFWQVFTTEEDELNKRSAEEQAVNAKFADRLVLLLDAARDNLSALKAVAKQDPPGMISHFEVSASVADKEALAMVIDRIVDLVDTHERRRREDEEQGRPVEKGAKDQANLQATIRETLYRSVFHDVSVKYANEQIRADGKPHKLSTSLSTGQKNALFMMWVLRLAQYRVEREARRLSTTVARRRARTKTQSLMIIDGLFSNLSEPHLIRSVLGSLPVARGNFQLIGLVHDADYRHDFTLFPNFVLGNSQNRNSWVRFDRVDEEGALAFAKLARRADGRS